jgi:hypothetical protein
MSPWYVATAQPSPPEIAFQDLSVVRGTVTIPFVTLSGTITTVTVESAPALSGPWTTESGATVSGPVNGQYTIHLATNGALRFYRAFAN